MKNFLAFLLVFYFSAMGCHTEDTKIKTENKTEVKIPFGDPFILLYNNTYYAYGTQAKDGIAVYTSNDMLRWETPENLTGGLALNKEDVWADRWFWAPEVYYVNGKFYMYYSADEHVCVAVSDSPLGPFKQDVQKPMIEGEKTIDNSMFTDEDGKHYLFFDRFNDGLNVWVAELQDNLIDIKPETMHPCIHVSQAWEEVWPRVNEGSFVIKHNGVYYMTYSANSYESPFYGIGVATATDIMGDWTKYEKNPIYQNVGDLVGIGHSAMFKDKNDKLRIVFHAHNSKTQIHPRNMYISTVSFETVNGKEIMKIDPNYITPLLIKTGVNTYRNPVIQRSTPDPTIIQVGDSVFYLFSTEDVRNLPIYRSTDLVQWNFVGTAFTNETRPTFEPKGGLWAPDINYINGKYVLYYSMSVWGGEWTCGIGVATADKPEGPFTDHGMLFRSNTIGVQNSIDQNYVEDNGKKYLFWGSFHGIFGIELTDDGLSIKPGSEKRQVAGTAYEGTYIHKRGKYYYLFASTGSCCEGLKSTYATVVGRSENLWGPYVDKQGRPMMDNFHEVVIHKNEAFVGTGHNSEIVQDKAGNDWIFYHGYSVANTTGRSLLMDKIIWKNDWPTVVGDSPSTEAEAPVFKLNEK